MRRRKYEEFEEDNGTVLRYARHDNGGGFVESHAHVDPAAYVAENAYVDRGAVVGAGRPHRERRLDRPRRGRPRRSQRRHHARTSLAGAVIGRDARIGARVKIGADAHVWDGARVDSDDVIRRGLCRPRRAPRAAARPEFPRVSAARLNGLPRVRGHAPSCTAARGMPHDRLTRRSAGRRDP